MGRPTQTRLPTAVALCAASALVGGSLAGHGNHVKALFNVLETPAAVSPRWDPTASKANATTRGAATTQSTTLFAMAPPRHHTGRLSAQGWRVVVTDEDAATIDGQFEMSYVKLAAGGTAPDTSPTGQLHRYAFWFFLGGLAGRRTMEFEVTFGVPLRLTEEHHGAGLRLPAAPSWPSDGISVAAQLNLPNDPLRPRVPAPFSTEVYAFEMPAAGTAATPLGGRTLDTLQFTTLYAGDPVLQAYVRSNAYGGGFEDLYGPESLHPDAARGDQLGFFLQCQCNGVPSTAYLLVSPTVSTTPLQLGFATGHRELWLSSGGLFPFLLAVGTPVFATGQLRFAPIPFQRFPPGFRDVWFQALVHIPSQNRVQLTDTVGVQGL